MATSKTSGAGGGTGSPHFPGGTSWYAPPSGRLYSAQVGFRGPAARRTGTSATAYRRDVRDVRDVVVRVARHGDGGHLVHVRPSGRSSFELPLRPLHHTRALAVRSRGHHQLSAHDPHPRTRCVLDPLGNVAQVPRPRTDLVLRRHGRVRGRSGSPLGDASTVRAGSVTASASRSALTHPAALGRCPGVGVRPYEGQAPSALRGFVRHGTVSEAGARPGLETRVPCLRLTARAGEDTPLLKSVNSGQEIATQALR